MITKELAEISKPVSEGYNVEGNVNLNQALKVNNEAPNWFESSKVVPSHKYSTYIETSGAMVDSFGGDSPSDVDFRYQTQVNGVPVSEFLGKRRLPQNTSFIKNALEETGSATRSALRVVPEMLTNTYNFGQRVGQYAAVGDVDPNSTFGKALEQDIQNVKNNVTSFYKKVGIDERFGDSEMSKMVGGAVGSVFGSLGLSLLAKSKIVAPVLFGTSQSGDISNELAEKGVTFSSSLIRAIPAGIAEAGLEFVGLEGFLKVIGTKTLEKRLLQGFLREGLQEVTQQSAEELIMARYREDEGIADKFNRILLSGIVGGLVGGGSVALSAPLLAKYVGRIQSDLKEYGVEDSRAKDLAESLVYGDENEKESAKKEVQRELARGFLNTLGLNEEFTEGLVNAVTKTREEILADIKEIMDAESDPATQDFKVVSDEIVDGVIDMIEKNLEDLGIIKTDPVVVDGKEIPLSDKYTIGGMEIDSKRYPLIANLLNQELSKGNDIKTLNDIIKATGKILEQKTKDDLKEQTTESHIEFNIASFYDEQETKYREKIAKDVGFPPERFNEIMAKANQIVQTLAMDETLGDIFKGWSKQKPRYKKLAKEMASRGYPSPIRSVFVTNGDYKFNVDFGTLCIKRQMMDKIIQWLMVNEETKGKVKNLTVVQMEELKRILRKNGISVACDVCFVEGKRLNSRIMANRFAYEWDSVVEAIGITDRQLAGGKRTLTQDQIEILRGLSDRRYIDDDGKILSEKELEAKKEEIGDDDKYKIWKQSHKQVYEEVFERVMPSERKRQSFIGGKKYLAGVTPDKASKIAKIFLQNPNLVGRFDPDVLLNSKETTALIEKYYDTDIAGLIGGYAGAGTPKPITNEMVYSEFSWHDMYDVKDFKKLEKMLYEIGGVRSQSFSDFDPMLAIDKLQTYLAMTIRSLPSHEYTKEPSLVKIFGDSGVMYNMSYLPKITPKYGMKHAGLRPATKDEIKKGKTEEGHPVAKDEDGYWTYDFHEDSFGTIKNGVRDLTEGFKLREQYKNAGIIVVGVSDLQIRMMLDDPRIDQIIPFHASGMPQHTKMLSGIGKIDYAEAQETKGLTKEKKKEIIEKSKSKDRYFNDGEFYFNQVLQELKDARKTADAYLKYCKENGLKPKFSAFKKGAMSSKGFTDHPNYYKLLVDFKAYHNGKAIVQQAVNISGLNVDEVLKQSRSAINTRQEDLDKLNNFLKDNKFQNEVLGALEYTPVDEYAKTFLIAQLRKVLGKGTVTVAPQSELLQILSDKGHTFREESTGQVYGFSQGGKIWLNENVMNAHTPLHEFGHIWFNVLRNSNKALYDEGVKLLNRSIMAGVVESDVNYQNIKHDPDLVASEIFARLVGQESEEMMREMLSHENNMHESKNGLIARIMDWLKRAIAQIGKALRLITDSPEGLTIEEFVRMPLRDLFENSSVFKKELEKYKKSLNESVTFNKNKAESINIEISQERRAEIDVLSDKQANSNVGKNLYDSSFDKWLENEITKQKESEIDEMSSYELLDLLGFNSLEDINEAIEDGDFDEREEPFKTEGEFVEWAKESRKSKIDVTEDINALESDDMDYYREEYSNSSKRIDFFDEYQTLVANILRDNGFFVKEGESRISDSRYLSVYKSEEDYEDGNELSEIRISDHDTHKFYGDHINLYTTKDIKTEIEKLVRSFKGGEYYGVPEFMYVGKQALDQNVVALTDAMNEKYNGASNEELINKYGWHQGQDGEWRSEISDAKAKVTNFSTIKKDAGKNVFKLGSVLDHEELYKNYPDLRDLPVWFDKNGVKLSENSSASLSPNGVGEYKKPVILVSEHSLKNKNKFLLDLLHEIQHWVQIREGFSLGGSPKMFDEYENNFNTAVRKYYSLLGEIESRDTEARKDLSLEERRSVLPEGLMRTDAIIYNGDSIQEAMAKIETSLREVDDKTKAERKQYIEQIADEVADGDGVVGSIKDGAKNRFKDFKDGFKYVYSGIRVMSSRARNISPAFMLRIRKTFYGINKKIDMYSEGVIPLIDGISKMNKKDQARMDIYLKNQAMDSANELCKKYDLEKELALFRATMDIIYENAKAVGIKVGKVDNYAPRVVKDKKGLLEAVHSSNLDLFTKMEKRIGAGASEDEKAEWLNEHIIVGVDEVTPTQGTSNTKYRSVNTITKELNKFYYPTSEAVAIYVTNMANAIQLRLMWGATEEVDSDGNNVGLKNTIGMYVNHLKEQGKIETTKDVDEVQFILNTLFTNHGSQNKFWSLIKGDVYSVLLTRFSSTISQLEDLGTALSLSPNPIYVVKGVYEAVGKRVLGEMPKINLEDLHVNPLTEEIRESGSDKAKRRKFLYNASLFTPSDKAMKEVYLNTRYNQLKSWSNEKLRKYLEPMFEEDTDKLIENLKSGNLTEDVKLLMFSELSDIQPISKAEMPSGYINNPNGRILYMLKTFQIKQFNYLCDRIMSSRDKKEVARLIWTLCCLVGSSMATQMLKDFIRGKQIDLTDTMIDAVLSRLMLSQYNLSMFKDGFEKGLSSTLIPAVFPIATSIAGDIGKVIKGDLDIEDMKMWSYVPLAGDFYYWWLGGGTLKK